MFARKIHTARRGGDSLPHRGHPSCRMHHNCAAVCCALSSDKWHNKPRQSCRRPAQRTDSCARQLAAWKLKRRGRKTEDGSRKPKDRSRKTGAERREIERRRRTVENGDKAKRSSGWGRSN